MRIGVVSDIHGDYQNLVNLVKSLKPEMIIHAGDGANEIQKLSSNAHPPFPASMIKAVRGNCDLSSYTGSHRDAFPRELLFSLQGWNVFLTHGHTFGVKSDLSRLRARGRELGADIIIFGHTHIPFCERKEGLILFNPGSLSLARCYGEPSYGLIEVTPEEINTEIIHLRPNK